MKGYRRSSIDSNTNTTKPDNKKKNPSSDEDSCESNPSARFRPSSNQRKGVSVTMCPVASN